MANVPTVSWNEDSPAGSGYVRAGDDRIRELKTQIREVVDVDHDFPSSGQAADVGQHKKMTLQEQADLGTGAEGVPILGAQTVSGKAELVFTDEDDNDIQITTAGSLVGADAFVSGDWIISSVTTAHTGWTNVSATYSNKFMRINATPLTTGGDDSHTHTGPSHTHSVRATNASIWGSTGTFTDNTLAIASSVDQNQKANSATSDAATAAGGTGNTGAASDVPAYVQVVIFQKD